MKRRIWFALLGLFAVLTGAATAWLSTRHDDSRLDFKLMDIAGQPRQASDWDGQVVLLNFWAPWCEPCREEIPLLVQLQSELGPTGLQILGLTEDEPEATRAFLAEQPVNYPVLLGLDAILALQSAYGETRLPFSVIVDRQGQVRYREAGTRSEKEWRDRLEPLLKTEK